MVGCIIHVGVYLFLLQVFANRENELNKQFFILVLVHSRLLIEIYSREQNLVICAIYLSHPGLCQTRDNVTNSSVTDCLLSFHCAVKLSQLYM